MLKAPPNKIVVKVPHKYIRSITGLLKRASIENASTVDPSDFVNIFGDVVAVPNKCFDRPGLEGYSAEGVEVVDRIMFSYRVIHDVKQLRPEADPAHVNCVFWNGEEYFYVDTSNLYAVIKDGQVYMKNGYVMLRKYVDNLIMLSNKDKKLRGVVESEILAIGEPRKHMKKIQAQIEDTAMYSPFVPVKYEVWENKPFVIVPQHKILAIHKKYLVNI